jgi:hypothetical protein
MAPPPFKVVGKLPEPLTVEETAATFRVSPATVKHLMTALRASLTQHRSKLAKTSNTAKPSKAKKASKAAKVVKVSKAPRRRTRQASKAAVRSSR